MKHLFASIITIILPITTMHAYCLDDNTLEKTPMAYSRMCINAIDFMLSTYEIEGAKYNYDFNFHAGYLMGQRKAYQDMCDRLAAQ